MKLATTRSREDVSLNDMNYNSNACTHLSIAINGALIIPTYVTKIYSVRLTMSVTRRRIRAKSSPRFVGVQRPSRFPWKRAAGRRVVGGALKWKGNGLWPEMISSGYVSAGQWSLLANTVTLRRGMIAGGSGWHDLFFVRSLSAPPALNTMDIRRFASTS